MDKEKLPKQRTSKGHEILIPQREEFLRDLKKAAKVKPSTPCHLPLPPLPSNTYSVIAVKPC